MKKTKMLKKNYEFKNVLAKGTYFSGRCIEVFVKENKMSDLNYLGIAISVKLTNAVNRNYIKRLIRESYKNIENDVKTGYSIVFLWKKKVEISKANYQNINSDIKYIFNKAKIFKEE